MGGFDGQSGGVVDEYQPKMKKRKKKRSLSLSQKAQNIGLFVLVFLVALAALYAFVPRQPEPVADTDPRPIRTEQATPEPKTFDPSPVAFIGDSYSAGAGASRGMAWTKQLADEMGWKHQVFAMGGTGYATSVDGALSEQACGKDYCESYVEVAPEVIDYGPELVIVSGGRNDLGKGAEAVGAAAADLFQTLKKELPDARVIVTSPIWDAREKPAELIAIGEAVESAAKKAEATYLDIGEPLAGKFDIMTDDQVHFHDEGHTLLAQEVLPRIEAALQAD